MRISDWSSDVCSSDLRSAPSGWPNCRLRSGGGARRDRLGERHRVAGAAQVRGQRILGFERGDDGLAQLRGLFSHAQVVEHLRRAQQQRTGVGDALAGDIGNACGGESECRYGEIATTGVPLIKKTKINTTMHKQKS